MKGGVGAAGQRKGIPGSFLKCMDELLKYALDHGMINMSYVQEQMEMDKRKELLNKHPYKIWEGKDRKWRTYIPQKNGERKLIKRNNLSDVYDIA